MKNMIFIFYLLGSFLLLACSSMNSTDKQDGEGTTQAISYSNPVLPGDYADPSVVRVGDDYWATATSSEWAPLFPLLHSTNLIDWETVDHVFPDKLPEWAESNFWAPEIAYENGRYYIYYTAKKKGGNLCVGVASATEPAGPYTDHGPLVCQDAGSIDGFEIRDEKGDLYLVWKEDGNSRNLPTPMWGQLMNEERTALLGEKFEMFRNDPGTWEGGLVEGAALIRKGDYFYTFYAGDKCCGRGCTYGVGVARAKTMQGPWEKHVKNPIMQQSDAWKCPGHGTVVTDKNGRDFFLYHAYSTESTVYPGRQGMLDEIKWGEDGWPYFEGNSPSATAKIQLRGNTQISKNLNIEDDFDTYKLITLWQWPVKQKPDFKSSKGHLILTATPERIGRVLGLRTIQANYTATTAVDKSSLKEDITASLAAIGDPGNAIGIGVSSKEISLWSAKSNNITVISKIPAPNQDAVQLRLTVENGNKMWFDWSTDGKTWHSPNNKEAIDASYLPPWDRGIRVGLTVKGPENHDAAFDWFRLNNQDSIN